MENVHRNDIYQFFKDMPTNRQQEAISKLISGKTLIVVAHRLNTIRNADQILVVQETEYTGAGKHPSPQLTFAKANGIEVYRGDPKENQPGKRIVIPDHPSQIAITDISMTKLRQSYLKNVLAGRDANTLSPVEIEYLAEEIRLSPSETEKMCR